MKAAEVSRWPRFKSVRIVVYLCFHRRMFTTLQDQIDMFPGLPLVAVDDLESQQKTSVDIRENGNMHWKLSGPGWPLSVRRKIKLAKNDNDWKTRTRFLQQPPDVLNQSKMEILVRSGWV